MSGPKCGTVVVDEDMLEAFRKIREESEKQEMATLELDKKNGQLSAEKESRLAYLEELERRRREESEEAMRAEIALLLAERRAEYERAAANLEIARSNREKLMDRFAGLILPVIPSFPTPNIETLESINSAIEQIKTIISANTAQTRAALHLYHQQVMVEKANEALRAWSAQLPSGVFRSAKDVIPALVSVEAMQSQLQSANQIRAMAERAREIMEDLAKYGDEELSHQTLEAIEGVLDAPNEARAYENLLLLRERAAIEKSAMEESRRKKKEAEEKALQERRRRMVASEIARALEDMGYTVSGVNETAFVSHGSLYAVRTEWPGHAMRFDFDSTGSGIISTPLRVVEKGGGEKSKAEAGISEKDAEFDRDWCRPDGGITRIKDILKSRKVGVTFSADNPPGSVELGIAREDELGETINKLRKRPTAHRPLKQKQK